MCPQYAAYGGTAWTILGWLGWKQIATSAALAVIGVVAGVMQNVPSSVVVMAAFCVFVAALYLAQLPVFIRATEQIKPQGRPNPAIWRHVQRMTLAQAACLLANVTPRGEGTIPHGDAYGWFQAIGSALREGEIQYIVTHSDPLLMIDGEYQPFHGTVISRQSLQQFAQKRGLRRPVLDDQ